VSGFKRSYTCGDKDIVPLENLADIGRVDTCSIEGRKDLCEKREKFILGYGGEVERERGGVVTISEG
jgi:hypothetical protein